MRKINKQAAIADFAEIVNKENDWELITDGAAKQNCRNHILVSEQEGLSAYTELYILEANNLHIDHYIKRAIDQNQTFVWDNLLVDIHDSNFGADYKDKCMTILAQYNEILNPVTDNAENYFNYALSGQIEPVSSLSEVDKAKAEKTIEVFNLQHNALVSRRKELIKNIQVYQKADIDNNSIKQFLESYGFKSLVIQYTQNDMLKEIDNL